MPQTDEQLNLFTNGETTLIEIRYQDIHWMNRWAWLGSQQGHTIKRLGGPHTPPTGPAIQCSCNHFDIAWSDNGDHDDTLTLQHLTDHGVTDDGRRHLYEAPLNGQPLTGHETKWIETPQPDGTVTLTKCETSK